MEKRNVVAKIINKIHAILALLSVLEDEELSEKTARTLVVIDNEGNKKVYKQY